MMRSSRFRHATIVGLVALLLGAIVAPAASALPAPSKTAVDQTLDERAEDLASIQGVLEQETVAGVLADHGLTADEVNQRLAQLSPEEIASLSDQVDQLQAAGQAAPMWIWVLVAVLIVVAIVAIA